MTTLKEKREKFPKRVFSALKSSPRLRMQIGETKNGILSKGNLKLSKHKVGGLDKYPKLYISAKPSQFGPKSGIGDLSIFVQYTDTEGNQKIDKKIYLLKEGKENKFNVGMFNSNKIISLGSFDMNQVHEDLNDRGQLSEGINLVYCITNNGELSYIIQGKEVTYQSSKSLMIYNNGETINKITFS
jgi:hypothetical protein